MLLLWIKEFFLFCRPPKPRTWNIKSPVSNQDSYWKSLIPFTFKPLVRSPKMRRINGRLREFIAYENQSTGVSTEKSLDTSIWKRIYCMQFLSYDMCGFKLLLKVLRIHWSKRPRHTSWSVTRDLKQWKTIKPSAQNSSWSFTRILIIKLCLGNVVFWVCSRVWKLVLWRFECMMKFKKILFYNETSIWRLL